MNKKEANREERILIVPVMEIYLIEGKRNVSGKVWGLAVCAVFNVGREACLVLHGLGSSHNWIFSVKARTHAGASWYLGADTSR